MSDAEPTDAEVSEEIGLVFACILERNDQARAAAFEALKSHVHDAIAALDLMDGRAKWMIRDALDTARVWLPELPEAALAAHSFESGTCEYCGAAEHPRSHAGESGDDIEF